MRDATFHILVALARGERHGYGIIQRVRDLTGGALRLGPGTLYGALDRLTSEGQVTATRTEVVEGRERRYYRLTDRGAAALNEEVERRAAAVAAAREELAGSPVPPGAVTP
ncbi:MAG TPA: PadR family transcriptional regulator [Acidimicrobiales bacterium]|nr:PadR family transcriptional regulator [Acidimicrobiales bacterium]